MKSAARAASTKRAVVPKCCSACRSRRSAPGKADFFNNPAESAAHVTLVWDDGQWIAATNIDFVGTSLMIMAPS